MLPCAQGETGIDTIRVVVPCFELTEKGQQVVRYKRNLPLLRIASGGDVVLGQSKAYVEASVARRVFGDNRFLLRGRDLFPAIESLLQDASELVDIAHRPTEIGSLVVNRIDAARDFNVGIAPAAIMDALASVDLPRRLQPVRHAAGGSTASLMVKTDSWSADLYDKTIKGGGLLALSDSRQHCAQGVCSQAGHEKTVARLCKSPILRRKSLNLSLVRPSSTCGSV